LINVPYDKLLSDLLRSRSLPTLTLFDARAIELFSIPERCDLRATVSSNVYIPDKYPTSLVLRHNKLWFEVPDENIRRYLLGYLSRPQWHGKAWDDLKNNALIPEGANALKAFFAAEAQQIDSIQILLDEIKRIDAKIDERVLDLYGITNAAVRQRILGSAPTEEEEETGSDEETIASDPL
jgi:type I restriction enzyme M protein